MIHWPLAIADTTPHVDTKSLALGFAIADFIYLLLTLERAAYRPAIA
jgi:hypothetical protein